MESDLQHEQKLVHRMLRGEERAFNEFFDEYFARLYRFALPRLNGDADAAEDVVQATLCRAMQKLETYRGEAALFTWICQICRRQVADHLRSKQRREQRVVLIEDSPAVQAAMDSISAPEGDEPFTRYGDGELHQLIRSVLDRLPSRYGDALELKYVEGLSVDEIAARLGMGPTAVQSMLARARVSFRDALEKVFGAAEISRLMGR